MGKMCSVVLSGWEWTEPGKSTTKIWGSQCRPKVNIQCHLVAVEREHCVLFKEALNQPLSLHQKLDPFYVYSVGLTIFAHGCLIIRWHEHIWRVWLNSWHVGVPNKWSKRQWRSKINEPVSQDPAVNAQPRQEVNTNWKHFRGTPHSPLPRPTHNSSITH